MYVPVFSTVTTKKADSLLEIGFMLNCSATPINKHFQVWLRRNILLRYNFFEALPPANVSKGEEEWWRCRDSLEGGDVTCSTSWTYAIKYFV